MQSTDLQVSFFKRIRDQLPHHVSLVDEVAELLNLSVDSAYRRIRAEKALSFDEIQLLAKKYNVSLDQFLHLQSNAVLFTGSYTNHEKYSLENYLNSIVKQLSIFEAAQHKEMFYLNKDIPIFHHFMFPELAAFKCYFWSRYNLNNLQFSRGQFLLQDFIELFNQTGKKIVDKYLDIPSTEIWNLDCINTTIMQIDYYRETKIFKSHEDIHTVYNCLEKLVDHIEQQVEAGHKFPYGKPREHNNVMYRIYVNEYLLGDNTVLVLLDGQKFVFMNHSVLNYFMTRDEQFTNHIYDYVQIILKKSMLITETGEKERQLFFDTLRHRIHEKRKLI